MAPKKHTIIPRLLLSLLVIVLAGIIIFRQQEVLDWWALRNYQAPVAVQALAGDTTMSAYGKRIFFVNKPQLQNKQAFYKSCEEGETSVVLGCYRPNNGIYILDVDDKRLDGIEQVTAAHELLHAVYDRLNNSERQKIGEQLQSFYAQLNDEQVSEKVDIYRKSGADISNELHSILGTEVSKLSPELEAHYSKYFTDRTKITVYASQYQEVFSSRKKKLQEYDAKLKEIDSLVRINNTKIEELQKSIKEEALRLEQLLKSGNITEYNQRVAAYNRSLVPYRTLIAETNALVAEYKSILDARNQVAAEAQELNKALDSRIQPVESNF
jgi:hypothetical protein